MCRVLESIIEPRETHQEIREKNEPRIQDIVINQIEMSLNC
jgi:hypothetical protein